MRIYKEICVGCGRCHPYCPSGAISFEDMKSVVDQDVCYECGNCMRVEVCPVDAISESPSVYEYPRAIRKFFSDPTSTHTVTAIQGRGTEESKTNDVTNRCGPDEVGIAIEVGRPTLGMYLWDIQKITRALAASGIHEIEPNNPIHSMIQNPETGDLKPDLLDEKVLSAIIEIQVKRDRLRDVLQTVKKAASQVESVFCLDVFTMLEPGLKVPQEILDAIESEGFSWRPNAKINMGLGRAWESGEDMTHSLHREGSLESLEKDYALFIYPARGFNYAGCASKVRRLVELVYLTGPANIIATTLRQNLYSGVRPEDVLDSIKDGCRVFSAFNSKGKVKEVLSRIKEADEGLSIVVSGLIDRVREMAAETGLNPHTINLSLGIHGGTDRLPPPDIRQFTTMCGHGMISPGLVRDVVRKTKTGRVDEWEGSLMLAKPCACGIYNPFRSEELLKEMTPVYTVDRW